MQLVYGGSLAHAAKQQVDVKGYTYIDKNGNRVVVRGFSRYQNRGSQDEARSKASLASSKYNYQKKKRWDEFEARAKQTAARFKPTSLSDSSWPYTRDKELSSFASKNLANNRAQNYMNLLNKLDSREKEKAQRRGSILSFPASYKIYEAGKRDIERREEANRKAAIGELQSRTKGRSKNITGQGKDVDVGYNINERASARAAEREEANEKYYAHPEDALERARSERTSRELGGVSANHPWRNEAAARDAEYMEAHERYYTPETARKMNQAAQEAERTQAKARWNNEATRLFGKDVGNALYKSSLAVGDAARAVAKKANELYSTATEKVSNIVKNIKEGGVGNFFSRVFNKGKDILSSIFGGIKTAANKVGEVASYVGQKVSTAASRLATMTKNTTQYQDFVNWSTTNVNRPIVELYNRTTKSVNRNVATPIKNFINNGIGFISALFAD